MKRQTSAKLLFSFTLLLSVCLLCRGEFFTSISELETLLRTEGELAKTLDKYVEEEEKRLERVRRLSREYQKMYKSAMGNAEAFLSNPVHAYLLVKHLTADWRAASQLIDQVPSRFVFENLTYQDLKFPDDEDLSGAATALIRLQDTYLLNTTKLASGEIEGTAKTWELSAGDCYELGYQAFLDDDHHYCIIWMQETLNKLEDEDIPTANRILAMEHMAYSSYMIGKGEDAERITQEIIDKDPSYTAAYSNLAFYKQYLKDLAEGLRGDIGQEIEAQSTRYLKKLFMDDFEDYEKLCRGERVQTLELQSRLHCRYKNFNNSYLFLQPIKEEELSLDPRIVVYYDVISDEDAEILKQLAIPRLERATVANAETGDLETAKYRVSKSSWLEDFDHPVVNKSSRFIQEVTGLATSSAEELHIINYGIGGHYEPHYDFRREGEADRFTMFGIGNRIATWIYYLTDVEAGGSTVFPSIGVQIRPKKGSAAFWYNLRKSGDGDLNTKHAACPVLTGSKWVANKWLHEVDNEFRRKCSIQRDE